MNSKYLSGLTRSTFLLAATSLFADISTEMLYPVLPIFLTQYLGASGSIVGLIEGTANATQNIIQGFSGWLADKTQKRKPLAILGYTLAAFSKPFIGLALAWPEVFAARFLDRLGTGTRSAPRDALIASSTDENNRGRAFGVEGIGDNLGAFLGPILTIILLFILKVQIRQIFYLALVPGLLAAMMVLFVKERAVIFKAKAKLGISFSQFPKSYWRYLLATALFGVGNISSAFMILQTKSIGVSLLGTILIYAFFNLIAALVSFPAGLLSDKFGRKNVLLASFVIFLISLLGFALSRNAFLITALFLLYGSYQGIFRAVGKALAIDLVPGFLRASGVGWYNTVVGLSSLLASILAGQVYDKVGHPATFAVAAVFVILGCFSLLVFNPYR